MKKAQRTFHHNRPSVQESVSSHSNNTRPDQSRISIPLFFAWITALLATAASITFIEILGNPVAPLCWIERMLMLGLLLLLTVGIIRRDPTVKFYAVPFLVLGIPSALYQQLVHWNIVQVFQTSCTTGFVCTTKYFELFGFVTQSTLCLTGFILIALFLSRVK